MRTRIIAVGTRMPSWVQEAVDDYDRRMRGADAIEWIEVPVARRSGTSDAPRAMAAEGRNILALLDARDHVVALDERGRSMDSARLAQWLGERRQEGSPLAFLIGGPDGFAPEVLERAQLRWSLSPLTFPHALVRVLLAEQLYRAVTMLAGHPYHRP
jgi:23S rRNA (pseudouridine1915-N3)-methyltransferase